MSGIWNSVIDGITGAAKWLGDNKEVTNLMGNALAGIGGYYLQKEQQKSLIKQQREALNLEDELKSKYSAVPDVNFSYQGLTVDDTPNLANGGILTEMKKRGEANNGKRQSL